MENIKVESTLPALTTNFDVVKAELESELSKYQNVVVTLDTLAQDKKLAQEITAKGREFDKLRKEKVSEISAPIKVFDDQMKSLKGICDNLAGTIKSQVKTFEDEKLIEIGKALGQALTEARQKADVVEDFFGVDMHKPLIKLTALTKTNKLTKASQSAIDEIVFNEKSNMQLVALRIAQLEAKSYEAGLDVPIAQVNVNHFILDSDDDYVQKLEQVISAELERQDQAKRRKAEMEAREIAKREAREKAEDERIQREKAEDERRMASHDNIQDERKNHHQEFSKERQRHEQGMYQQQPEVQQEQTVTHQVTQQAPNENIQCMAQANFLISVPSRVSDQQIKNKLVKMLESAGITSLSGIEVIRNVSS